MITPEQVKNDPAIRSYIQKADACLSALGYTEHSFAHVGRVASEAKRILLALGKGQRQATSSIGRNTPKAGPLWPSGCWIRWGWTRRRALR